MALYAIHFWHPFFRSMLCTLHQWKTRLLSRFASKPSKSSPFMHAYSPYTLRISTRSNASIPYAQTGQTASLSDVCEGSMKVDCSSSVASDVLEDTKPAHADSRTVGTSAGHSTTKAKAKGGSSCGRSPKRKMGADIAVSAMLSPRAPSRARPAPGSMADWPARQPKSL